MMRHQMRFTLVLCCLLGLWNGAQPFAAKQVLTGLMQCGSAGAGLALPQPFSVPGRAISLTTSDFNQDGKPDLAVAATTGSDTSPVTILLGDGGGYLEAAFKLTLVSGVVYDIAAGDFNRDGNVDLAVSGPEANSTTGVASLLGNGDGTFQLAGTFAAGTGASGLALADFNGDGQLDIATANKFANDFSVLRGSGNGTFAAPLKYELGRSVSVLAATDVNGDNRADLLVPGASLTLFLNNGAGGFDAPVNLPGPSTSAIAINDFNGDNRLDLALGQSDSVAILLSDGRGGFAMPKTFSARTANSIIARDFNGDGKLDLACAAYASVVLLLGTGNGEFGAPVEYAAGKLPYALAGADFNLDGRADVMVLNLDQGNSGATQLALLLGLGAGGLQAPFVASGGSFPAAVSTGDLNKDGKPDLIIPNNSSVGVHIALNDGQGRFGAPQRLEGSYGLGGNAAAAVAHDFNRDGNVDLAVATSDIFDDTPGQAVLLHGKGDGTFDRTRTRSFNVGKRPADLLAADFNGDGQPDLATANVGSNDVSVLLSNNSGGFKAQTIPVGLEPRSLVSGDFNSDSKLDLAVANRNTATLSLLFGNGDGTFSVAPLGISANPRTVRTGDFNNDGRLDLLVPQNNAAFVSVLLGNGNGTFSAPLNTGLGSVPFAVTAVDFTGDGKLDLAATVYFYDGFLLDKVLLYAGDGTGRFQALGEFTIPPATYLTASDFNADGLADLVALTSSQSGGAAAWIILGRCNSANAANLVNASAASYRRLNLASGMIVAAFGNSLSTATAAATMTPLPTQLAGTSVMVRDSAGNERLAPLFFVSARQINYQLPMDTASGSAVVTVRNGSSVVATAAVLVTPVAPGLFAANANGQGVPAGVALRVKPNGTQSYEPLAQFDVTQNQFVPAAIDVYGVFPPNINDQIYLILFGTGLRGRSAQANVRAYVGGIEVPVQFASAQGQLVGVDQVNLALPKSLVLRGELEVLLTVDGKLANAMSIKIL